MKLASFVLTPRLSTLNWFFIEGFALIAIVFLPFSKSTAHISIVISVVLWLSRKMLFGEKFPSVPPCNVAYAVLLAATLLSFIPAPREYWPLVGVGCSKWLLSISVFFMCVEFFQDPKRLERFLLTFLAVMTFVCLNGFYQVITGEDLLLHRSVDIPGRLIRMTSSFRSPFVLSAFLILPIPIIFSRWVETDKWCRKSVLYVTLLALFSVAFLATLSRAAFVGLFLSVVLYVFFKHSRKFLLIILFSPAILLISNKLRYNFFTSLSLKDITVGERLQLWAITQNMIKEHPLLGNGVNIYEQLFPSFAPLDMFRGGTHNCYLQVWSEMGLFGVAALLTPFFVILWRELARKSIKRESFQLKDALLVGIIAYLLQSLFDNNFFNFQASLLFWIFWGMLVALLERLPSRIRPTAVRR